MKKFSDLGITIQKDQHIFKVPMISIEDILNIEIEILDFEKGVKTQHGADRYILKVRNKGIEGKFFTNSSRIKEAIDKVDKKDLPFLTTIIQEKFGSGSKKTFYLT